MSISFSPTTISFSVASRITIYACVSQSVDQKNFVSSITDTTTIYFDTGLSDITPPLITNIEATPNPFSPNNDGINDKTLVSFTVNENCTGNAYVTPISSGTVIPASTDTQPLKNQKLLIGPNFFTFTGNGFPEGSYKITISVTDDSGNKAVAQSATVNIDLKPPKITDVSVLPDPINPAGLND